MDREREQIPASQSENVYNFPQPETGTPDQTPEDRLQELKEQYEESLFHLKGKSLEDLKTEKATLEAMKMGRIKAFFTRTAFMMAAPHSEPLTMAEIDKRIKHLTRVIANVTKTKQSYESKLAGMSKIKKSEEPRELDQAA